MSYTATSLIEIAEAFETFASDQIASKRFQQTAKAKAECEIRANVWNDAAQMLRETTLGKPDFISRLEWLDPAFPARFEPTAWQTLIAEIKTMIGAK